MIARAAVLALVTLVTLGSARADERPRFDATTIYRVPRGASPTEGPTTAPVTIVVWSDFACGYCVRVQATLDQLRRLYPGQLRFVHRTLPLDEDNLVAAEAALAASAQGRFAPMKDRLYALAGRVDRPAVELIARELGLDLVRFRADLDTGAHRAQIAADVDDARKLGVTGTPTFFVNRRAVHGSQSLRIFADVVDEELVRAGASATTADYDRLVVKGQPTAASEEPVESSFELDPRAAYRVGLGLPGHQLGPDDAPVTLVVWSDFQCPFCARSAPIVSHVAKKYGRDVRIVFRHFPVQGHRNAQLAAEAAVAAAEQGKFWAFQDQIWKNFGQLSRADLETFATAAGLDLRRFDVALETRRYRDAVVAEAAAASATGVDGTPTMFINGAPIVGSKHEGELDAVIDDKLAQAKRAVEHGLPAGDVYPLVMTSAIGSERADPSTIPAPSAVRLEMRPDERGRGVAAACRRHDATRAKQLAVGLAGDHLRRAVDVCATAGIDL
ncbi:MAG: thioredoxin domain-containing protein [Proteobacteria bacterium]|nr:thioredoxin domain-containing protein [Pseudomonadota bacterium]